MTILLLALACAPPDEGADTAASDAVDLTLGADDYPGAPDGGFEIWGPDVVVQPGQDVMWCLFGTYDGDDVGVVTYETWQNAYGHHLQLMGTTASELDYADGELLDCTATGSLPMADLEPLALPTGGNVGDIALTLPAGTAVKLDAGQRWVIQAHYVNTSTEPFRAKDVATFGVVPEAEVETWAAPLVMNNDAFEVPAGEAAEASFDCAFANDYHVLYLLGHMHEWGTAYKVEQLDGAGGATTVYEVAEWTSEYRDAPPTESYAPGEYLLPAGTTMRTTCAWFNDTSEALTFPNEMCATVGMVYPALTPDICSP